MSGEVEGAAAAPAPQAPPPAHVALVEALLFASGRPASVERLAEASELTPAEVEAALDALERVLEQDGRGVRLDRVAGGARLVSRNEFDVPVRKLLGLEGKNKLSMASLETLSIIAYRQPVTAPEIAELRGVSSASSLRTLLDKKLITTAGRKEVVGDPLPLQDDEGIPRPLRTHWPQGPPAPRGPRRPLRRRDEHLADGAVPGEGRRKRRDFCEWGRAAGRDAGAGWRGRRRGNAGRGRFFEWLRAV